MKIFLVYLFITALGLFGQNIIVSSQNTTTLTSGSTTKVTTDDVSTIPSEKTSTSIGSTAKSSSTSRISTSRISTSRISTSRISTSRVTTKSTSSPPVTPSNPKVVQFYVTKSNYSNACFLVEFTGSITFSYQNSLNKQVTVETRINKTQFNNAVQQVDGICNSNNQQMNIEWPNKDQTNTIWHLFINTTKFNKTEGTFYKMSQLVLTINPDNKTFPGLNSTALIVLTAVPQTRDINVKNYFSCQNQVEFKLNPHSGYSGSLTTTLLKIQAYRKPNESGFYGPADSCGIDQVTKNIVPLIVGGVLAIMVAVVLVTYLIGRRRHRSNYQTI